MSSESIPETQGLLMARRYLMLKPHGARRVCELLSPVHVSPEDIFPSTNLAIGPNSHIYWLSESSSHGDPSNSTSMSPGSSVQFHHHGRFRIAGGVLPDAITAYRTYGDPANPCIVFPTCYGGRLDSTSVKVVPHPRT